MMMVAQTLVKWSMASHVRVETRHLQILALKSAEMGLISASMSVMMATPTPKMVAQAAARLSQAGIAQMGPQKLHVQRFAGME
jgi:hypothetical protein